MNLKNLKQEEGIRGVAKHVLNEYQGANQLHREMQKVSLHVKVYKPFHDYVMATAKSQRKAGERLNEIILSEIRERAKEEKGMF